MISDARARPPLEDEEATSTDGDDATGQEPADVPVTPSDARPSPRKRRRAVADAELDEPVEEPADEARPRRRLALPLVPLLAVLLVLLLAALAYLWSTRPEESAIETDSYVEALQAARSGIVDLTSFDHLTIDDDIAQIERITTGDLREESVAQLEQRRQELTDTQAVVNTEVIGAGVLRADEDDATVLLVIQATQRSAASPQAQVVRYRIQAELQRTDGRWLLSGISGR